MSDVSSQGVPEAAVELSDDDYMLLEAFVKSPIYPVYMKALNNSVFSLYRLLEGQTTEKDVWLTLGRINGIRFSQNIIPLSVEAKRKQKKAEVEKAERDKRTKR